MWGRGEKYILYLARTSGGNRARGRPTSRWEWKIKMYRREINGVAWIKFIWLKTVTSYLCWEQGKNL